MENREKKLPFAHATGELARNFLDEKHYGMEALRDNFKSFLSTKDQSKPETILREILKDLKNSGHDAGFLMLMLAENHPILKSWPENQKRLDLFEIMSRKIVGTEFLIAEHELDIARWGMDETTKELDKEMRPYKKFSNGLFERAIPAPASIRK